LAWPSSFLLFSPIAFPGICERAYYHKRLETQPSSDLRVGICLPVGSKVAVESKLLEGGIETSRTPYFRAKRRADLDNFNKLDLGAASPFDR
jgi:hypothetical protein